MTASMISFSTGEWRFHFRAAAVVRVGDLVLLHRMAEDLFWALPGGRVEAGETAELAVAREMREELGVDVQVGALAAVVENFFTYRGRPQHTVELHFKVTLPQRSPLAACEPFERVEDGGIGLNGDSTVRTRLQFRWFHIDELGSIDLRPAFLRDSLRAGLQSGALHVVHDERR